MLRHLHVRNLAVIEDASVEFGSGLNVVTGETGAGKSIVVDALALLAGARADSDLIRRGADGLTVSGVFEPGGEDWRDLLASAGIAAENDEILIRREVSHDGPNRIYLDDQPITLRLLSRIAPTLMRIHAQREELGLVSPEFQRQLLDRSGGSGGEKLLSDTRQAYEAYRTLRERWERLAGDQKARLERLDLLRFQRQEIDEAQVRAGEEVDLRADRDVLRHGEAIRAALGGAFDRLFEDEGSASERLAAAARSLEEVSEWEPHAAAWGRELEELRIRLDELSREVAHRLQEVDADPRRLDEVEDRLALLERLFRKYGADSHEVLAYRKQVEAELDELTMDEDGRAELESEIASSLEVYASAARKLSKARRGWGRALVDRVHGELADLAMGRARFSVGVSHRAASASPLRIAGECVDFGPSGIDEVSFGLAANPGEAEGPLSAVASGGELSRVYLALRLAVGSGVDAVQPSLVFDEIDSGVGGAEAAALGKKLRRLAETSQVFAVTHLAQVASCGHHHYRVRKQVSGERTRIAVEALADEARIEEVARMLAGKKITSLSRSHAEELLAGVG